MDVIDFWINSKHSRTGEFYFYCRPYLAQKKYTMRITVCEERSRPNITGAVVHELKEVTKEQATLNGAKAIARKWLRKHRRDFPASHITGLCPLSEAEQKSFAPFAKALGKLGLYGAQLTEARVNMIYGESAFAVGNVYFVRPDGMLAGWLNQPVPRTAVCMGDYFVFPYKVPVANKNTVVIPPAEFPALDPRAMVAPHMHRVIRFGKKNNYALLKPIVWGCGYRLYRTYAGALKAAKRCEALDVEAAILCKDGKHVWRSR